MPRYLISAELEIDAPADVEAVLKARNMFRDGVAPKSLQVITESGGNWVVDLDMLRSIEALESGVAVVRHVQVVPPSEEEE